MDRGVPPPGARPSLDPIGPSMSFSAPSRKVAALAVAGSGLALVLSGAFAPAAQAAPTSARVAAPTAESSWFQDPRTPAERRAEVAVPKKPKKYTGRVQETRAVYRTRAGALAVPMRDAVGHRVTVGQAVTLDGNGLFVVNRTQLTGAARSQISRLAVALADASTVRCEGYADYAGKAKWNRILAAGRAAAVCDLLVATNPGLQATTTAYGPTWPAVLGGTSEDRRLNRRVVVEMTGARPVAPVVPVVPTPPVGSELKAPGAPVLDRAAGQFGSLYYEFTAPTDDGGSPVTGYEVSLGAGWEPVSTTGLGRVAADRCRRACYDGLWGVVYGQPAGVSRDLQVRAVNKVGPGAPSNTLAATPYGMPGAPSDLTVVGGDGTLTTTFTAPANDGGSEITGYEISYDGGDYEPVGGSGPTWSVVRGSLTNGTTHDVAVRARNVYGASLPATGSARVATVPDAPWLESDVDLDGTRATLTFTTPQRDEGTDGGSPITRYELSQDGGQSFAPFTYTVDPVDAEVFHFELADLTLGTAYSVAVRAVNERGVGAASKVRSFTPALVPDQPTDVVASASGSTVTLTFTTPAYDGGAEIEGYEVRVDAGGWAAADLDSSGHAITLTGQVSGTHTYQVRAVNRVGESFAGTSNEVVVSAPVPSAPAIIYVGYNGYFGAWDVGFTEGATNGAAITGYEVSVAGGPWIASTSHSAGNALFPCGYGDCDWTESSPIRLRAVAAGEESEPSATYVDLGPE